MMSFQTSLQVAVKHLGPASRGFLVTLASAGLLLFTGCSKTPMPVAPLESPVHHADPIPQTAAAVIASAGVAANAASQGQSQGHGGSSSVSSNVAGNAGQPALPVTELSGLAVPADVCGVLKKNGCVGCHRSTAVGGAPMSLQMRDDFAVKTKDGTTVSARVLARGADAQNPMPPASTMRSLMPAAELAVLKTWIDGGLHGVPGSACEPSSNANDDLGSDAVPAWATSNWPAEQCEYVLTLGAHGTVGKPLAEDTTGFPIPASHTNYECFYEKVPWGDKKVQALAVRARIETPDDMAIVHHLVVSGIMPFQMSISGAAPSGPGDHKPCDNPSGGTVNVWAPGSFNPLSYPPDVGVLLPSGDDAYMELQVHYNNSKLEAGKQSRVQYDICVTSKLRPQTAAVFWLGYENAFADTLISGQESSTRLDNQNDGSAIGKCEAKTKTRILNIMPHMHQQGRRGKVEIVRKDGSVQPVLDKPFDFRDQTSYFRDNLWLDQGDNVRTTCYWDKGPIYFGFASDTEMCFFYTLAYPVEAFQPGLDEKGFVGSGGNLACAAKAGP